MKLRNREVNIFSMSALDLFASGMGAFILLAIMALPFFPHTGTDAQVIDLSDELEQAQRERDSERERAEQAEAARDQAQRNADELSRRVSELEVPDLDLVICLDVTGSMSEQIEALKSEVASLAEILNRVAPTGIGIIAFGDDQWDQTLYVLEVTTNIGDIQAFVNRIAPNMNAPESAVENTDAPEAIAEALERVERMNWRAQSVVRHVVVISDYPAQRQSAALEAASRIGSASDYHVSAVMVRNEAGTRTFMQSLAQRGNGEFIDGNMTSMLGAILLAVLG